MTTRDRHWPTMASALMLVSGLAVIVAFAAGRWRSAGGSYNGMGYAEPAFAWGRGVFAGVCVVVAATMAWLVSAGVRRRHRRRVLR